MAVENREGASRVNGEVPAADAGICVCFAIAFRRIGGMTATSDMSLSSSELARYSRHILLEEIGVAGQEKLKAARALIIGAGGLGSPVALYLAAAGVGTLGIADFDTVELHNLQRQILHGASDVDRPKIESARDTLREINPHVAIQLHPEGARPDNAVALFGEYDIVIDGSDNFATRYLNNDAAFFARKPLVYGSIFKFEGQVSLFDSAAGGPCYRCLFPEPPPPGSVPNCGEAGVMGALCGIVGSAQTMEAIKRIVGIGDSLMGRLLVVDTLRMSFRSLNLKKDPNCPLCGEHPTITRIEASRYDDACATQSNSDEAAESATEAERAPLEIDIFQAKALLEDKRALLLDVREPYERAICSIEGSIAIPMREIPARLGELPRDHHILVHCHHGPRSLRVTQYLRDNGLERSSNVAGGIDAWASEIDQTLQRY